MKHEFSVVVSVLCSLSPLACGRVLPLLNPRSHALESGSAHAKVDGSESRALAAIARAQSAQHVSMASQMSSEQLATERMVLATQLKIMAGQATNQADAAAAANDAAISVAKSMKGSAQATVKAASDQAVQGVQSLLSSGFNELDTWRKDTLQNKYEDATADASKRSLNFRGALNRVYGGLHASAAGVAQMAAEAHGSVASAQALSKQAQEENNSGNRIAATEALRRAQTMLTHSSELARQAQAQHDSMAYLNQAVPLYYSAGVAARTRALSQGNPDMMPPLQVDANAAFVPPPA